MASAADLLRIENLDVSFSVFGDRLRVVKEANLRILPGKVTALVGESGSGKSVISQSVMGILPNPAKASGRILFTDPLDGSTTDILSFPRDSEEMRDLRGRRMATIFQEPMTSLSPLHTIGNQISEVLLIHTETDKQEARERTEEMLGLVGFSNPHRTYDMYPFELSGGMRQRAMIAMALICKPALLIADEPTTALDVTIQAQILELLRELQAKLGMAMLLITHDLGIVANMADEVVVIYHGEIMEAGPVE
ncbi:ABC transporter ATP-binding protein, partial [Rhizobium ruizarguesonis]